MRWKRPVAVLGALVLSACSQFSVRATSDPSFHFGDLKTFAWVQRKESDPWDRQLARDRLDVVIVEETEATLRSKGFQPASGTPDFLVNYHVGIGAREDLQGMAYGLGYGLGWYQVTVDDYSEGTLTIHVIDARTKNLVWRGSAEARLLPNSSLERRRERVREATQQIMAKFPPA